MPSVWRFLKKHLRLLCAALILAAAVLQTCSLYHLYGVRRQQLLNRAELIIEKKLFSLGVEALVRNPRETMAATFRSANADSLLAKIPAGSVLKPTIIIRNSAPAATAAHLPSFTIAGPQKPVEEDWDSLLYIELRAQLPRVIRSGTTLSVGHVHAGKGASYPAGPAMETSVNTTRDISMVLLPGTVFRARFQGVATVLLGEMAASIATAGLYLLIFAATLFAFARALAYQSRLYERQKVFTRNMTHELKIPISTLSVAAEALQKGVDANSAGDRDQYFAAVQRSIRKLSGITDEILANARLEEARQPAAKTAVGLRALLLDVQAVLQPQLDTAAAVLDIGGIAPDCTVYGSREQLAHVFLNLIDNAVKYAKGAPVIRIAQRSGRGSILISVADNGPGIDKAYHNTVFEPYFRIDNSDAHEVKGYGLGLSFVRQILRVHGGDAFVESSGAEGTTITLKLPAHVS